MGYALALAAARRGAAVTLVSGPVALDAPGGVTRVDVTTAVDMDREVRRAARGADAVIMAAAVADFRPTEAAGQKIKKREGRSAPVIELEHNPDILAGLGRRRRGKRPVLVGFAAETEDVVAHARRKLKSKGCDLVVANDVSQPDAGFDVDTNRVTLIGPRGADSLELASKDEVAHRILDRVVHLLVS